MFDISGNGKSKLENTKNARLYDVLIYASEKRDMQEAMNKYYKSLYKK